MREKEDLNYYMELMQDVVSPDRGRSVPRCRDCPYYHPDFKYRRCLYASCPYGKSESEVFRKHPLRRDRFSSGRRHPA